MLSAGRAVRPHSSVSWLCCTPLGSAVEPEVYRMQATDDGLGMGYRIFNAPRTFGFTVSHRWR